MQELHLMRQPVSRRLGSVIEDHLPPEQGSEVPLAPRQALLSYISECALRDSLQHKRLSSQLDSAKQVNLRQLGRYDSEHLAAGVLGLLLALRHKPPRKQ